MKKFLIKITIYTFLILLLSNGMALISLYFIGKSNLYKPQFLKNGVKENHFDYIVLGSSTGLTTLDTKKIDEILNTKGLNISMDDSSLNSHYLMLQYFYALGKKTKTLVLAITPWDVANKTPKLNNNDYRFLSEINQDLVFEYFSEIETEFIPILQTSKFLPILGVSYYNNELFYPSLFTVLKPQKRNRFDEKGNYSYPNLGGPIQSKLSITELKFKNPYFQKIKQFCHTHGITLVLYQSPLYKNSVNTDSKDYFINHSNFISADSLFYDNLHVNSIGRAKCSEDFAVQFNSILYANHK
jgi:hypothetical protein